jgi:hypothetical protein
LRALIRHEAIRPPAENSQTRNRTPLCVTGPGRAALSLRSIPNRSRLPHTLLVYQPAKIAGNNMALMGVRSVREERWGPPILNIRALRVGVASGKRIRSD